MITNIKRLVLVSMIFLLFGCSNLAPGTTGGIPTEDPLQIMQRTAAETSIAQTAVAPPAVSTAAVAPTEVLPVSVPLELLTVIFPDGSQVGFTADDLRALPESTVSLKNKEPVTGIPVLSILDQAGWSRYTVNTISIQGVGLIKLSKAQLDGNFLLIVGDRNIQFASPLVPKRDWLSGVTTIALY